MVSLVECQMKADVLPKIRPTVLQDFSFNGEHSVPYSIEKLRIILTVLKSKGHSVKSKGEV